jgi:hypothetical protein
MARGAAVLCKDVVDRDNGKKLPETERVKKVSAHNTKALKWLKNRQPEHWREESKST